MSSGKAEADKLLTFLRGHPALGGFRFRPGISPRNGAVAMTSGDPNQPHVLGFIYCTWVSHAEHGRAVYRVWVIDHSPPPAREDYVTSHEDVVQQLLRKLTLVRLGVVTHAAQ